MAEAPERYCSDCGHVLSLEDQLCPNCERPVHLTERVPTPEANLGPCYRCRARLLGGTRSWWRGVKKDRYDSKPTKMAAMDTQPSSM